MTMTNRNISMSWRRAANGMSVVCFVAAVFMTRLSAQGDRVTVPETQKFLRTSFREALTRLSPRDFTPVARFEDIVNAAYFESRHWMNAVFGEVHDPNNDALHARHSYYIWRGGQPGFDLLRHQYDLDSRAVTVTESAGIIDVAVRLSDTDEARRLGGEDRASKIANWLLRLPAEIHFVPDSSEGWLVSNAENGEKAIQDWKERIYAISKESAVEFFIYKEDPMLRPEARNYSVWFDAEFRKHPPKAASQ
jgi:hypothetical protein